VIIDESFGTDDIGEAETIVRRVYPKAELGDPEGQFRYEHLSRGVDGVNFTRFKINSRMDIAVDFDGVAAFGLLLGGRYAVESNGRQMDAAQPFLFTPGPGSSRSEDLDLLTINIDTEVLERAAGQQFGLDRARLRFDDVHAAASPALRAHWLQTIHYAWNSVMRSQEVFRNDAIRSATVEAVVTAALAAFPIEIAEAVRMSDFTASAAVRRAKSFIDDNADQPITVAQIAEAARLSVRALQLGFQRELELTPTAYLRDVRLEAARRDLLDADGGARVAVVARRWGFANPGRFAALYRSRFGESPGATVRR
jgi:AraC-like DNA-binding protein